MRDRITVTVSEAADAMGLSRAQGYELVKTGAIPSVRLGGRILVPVDGLRERIAELLRERAGR